MRKIAGDHGALAGEGKLLKDLVRLAADLAVAMRQSPEVRGLALAREYRQGDIVEGGEVVEDVDQLEAARDPRPYPLGGGGAGDVPAHEQNPSGVRPQQRADDIDKRRLAGAVRPDQRDELAFLDGNADVVDGARIAEIPLQVDGLEQRHFTSCQ